MEFRILGQLEVVADGRALDLGGLQQRAILLALLVDANRTVSTDRLIDTLWEAAPPATAQKAVQVHISQLRKLLGSDRLQTRAPGYALHVEPDELDLACFERLWEEGRLREALAVWRGPPLPEFVSQRFAQAEISRLEERRLLCLEQRIDEDLAAGRHAGLAAELEALIRLQPLRERLRSQLMLALYRSARQAEALECYQEGRRALVEELGIEPGRALRDLHQAILRQDEELDLPVAGLEPAVAVEHRSALIGRERELAELVVGLDDAFAGRGSLFLLVGEPGIGKSRLADELINLARARAARVVIGRCWEAGGAPAYWPWVQSLRACIKDTEHGALRLQLGAGASDLAQLLPELRELLPDVAEPPMLEPEGARFRLFEAVSSFLTHAAQARPLVLVLDDLHAADEPSLLLLRFLGRQLGESKLLVVGALRDIDPIPSHPLTAALTELAREPTTRRLALPGLDEQQVAQFIELIAGEPATGELAASIHGETEGNPLFVGEIVRLLAAEGGIGADAPRVAIPQSVRDVIARRLRHLSPECNRVLVLASVFGREFGLDELARLSDLSEDELLDTLDEAMGARVVADVPGSPGRLRFAHVLIRETLYEGLTTARRVRVHRSAVLALESLYGDEPGPHLAELTHQSIAASDFEKGVRYARRAGDRALSLLAYEEAARLYETAVEALDISDPGDQRLRCELIIGLGEAEARAGNTAIAKQAFLAAAEIARRTDLPHRLAQAAAGYGGRLVWSRAGNDDQLVPLLEDGLAALAETDVELRARLLARLAGALRDEHSRARRERLSQEAVELARRTESPAALAYALEGRAAAILGGNSQAELLVLASELRELSGRIGDTERMVQAHIYRVVAQLEVCDISGAEIDLAEAKRIANELRQPAQLWTVHAAEAMLALASGRLTEATELVPQALALGERAQPDAAIPVYWLQRYSLYDFHGDPDELEPAIRELVSQYPARPAFRCVLAHLYARLGRTDDARRAFDEFAADHFAALPLDMEWLYGMSLLAETTVLLGDAESADILYGLLLPWSAFNAVDQPEGMRGSVSRYLGILAASMKRWEEAERHFRYALETNERMGARPWLAHTQHDYGRMLLGRRDPGDTERAQELLDHALANYQELGMKSTR
jgi:DNA-binding SARP family transcriptional activator